MGRLITALGAAVIAVRAALATHDAEAADHHDRVPHAPAALAALTSASTSTGGDMVVTLLPDHLEYVPGATSDRIAKDLQLLVSVVFAYVVASTDGRPLRGPPAPQHEPGTAAADPGPAPYAVASTPRFDPAGLGS